MPSSPPPGPNSTTSLVPYFQQLQARTGLKGEKNLPILHYIVPHKRESIYPIGGNRMVILMARRGKVRY